MTETKDTPEEEYVCVVDFKETVKAIDKDLKKRATSLERQRDQLQARIEDLEDAAANYAMSPVGVIKERLTRAMAFIGHVSQLDHAFYRQPNDWHVGLEMVKRAQLFLEEDQQLQKQTVGLPSIGSVQEDL